MKDKVEIRAGVTITREEYEELHKAFNEPDTPKFGRWKPEKDGSYWLVTEGGHLRSTTWDSFPFDLDCLAVGNIYRTREEAQNAADRQRAIVVMRDKADRVRTHPEPDRTDVSVWQYFVKWAVFGDAEPAATNFFNLPPEVPVFATPEERDAFIKIAAWEVEYYFTGKRPEGEPLS